MSRRGGAFAQWQVEHQQNQERSTRRQQTEAERELKALGLFAGSARKQESEEVEELDEAGYFPEGTPFQYVPENQVHRDDGMEYVVAYERIAIRKEPGLEGRVLGVACRGERLLLYDDDSSKQWRSIHFRLRGGRGSLVIAWVLLRHPELGTLLRPAGASPEDDVSQDPAPLMCSCGRAFGADEKFCPGCGARRPEAPEPLVVAAVEEVRPRRQALPWSGVPRLRQPRGYIAAPQRDARVEPRQERFVEEAPQPAASSALGMQVPIAEGNLLPLTAQDLSALISEGSWEAVRQLEDGCRLVSSTELEESLHRGSEEYVVVHDPYVAIRSRPTTQGVIVGSTACGQPLETFGWDETSSWRRVFGKLGGQESSIAEGWMLVSSRDVGELLRPLREESHAQEEIT